MTTNVSKLPYNFHWDRDVSLNFLQVLQVVCPFLSLLTWHPMALYILIRHPRSLSKENRAGYIALQITVILLEWTLCWLVRVYPLVPYPAFFCDGLLCRLGLQQQTLLTILATSVVLPNVPFCFLLLTVHQQLLSRYNSRFRFSQSTQRLIMLVLVILMFLNVVGFGVFGAPSVKSRVIGDRPELAWLKQRRGQLLIFGDIGDPEYFRRECYFLTFTQCIVHPSVILISCHAIYFIRLAKEQTSDATAVLQRRAVSVLLIQVRFKEDFLHFAHSLTDHSPDYSSHSGRVIGIMEESVTISSLDTRIYDCFLIDSFAQ